MVRIHFEVDKENARQRKDLGKWLKALRASKEWTQAEAARHLGYEWFTFIAQVEGGHARIPTDAWELWARTYGVDPRKFAMRLLRAYDPHLFKLVKSNDRRADEED